MTHHLSTIVQHIIQFVVVVGIALTLAACGAASDEITSVERVAIPTAVIEAALPTAPTTAPPPATATAAPLPSPTPEPQPARFAVIGDFGMAGQPEADVASLVKSWNPDFIVTTGDNNYPSGAAETIDQNIGQYYHEYIFPYQGAYGAGAATNRFFPILGNHDLDTANGQPYFDYFTLPGNERYYTVTHDPVGIFALNSMPGEPDGIDSESVQAAWLQQELAASNACWKLVFYHHAAYTSGHRGSSEWMRWPFQAWGADATLSGHNHVYERVMEDGFPHFVNGLGGGPRYAFADENVAGSEVRYNADHGAMLVEATQRDITFQFVTRTGEVIDTYSMEKACP